MRLLNTKTLEVEEFLTDIPIYAILSHTWEKEEVELKDIQDCRKLREIQKCQNFEEAKRRASWKKAGWSKIWNACKYAQRYKFEWIWIDTCCIDKSSSAELSEALNSMYKYYGEGRECIAYLSDVSNGRSLAGSEKFKKSRWFERGWTLQELIAPRHMVFLDQEWNTIGTRFSMRHVVSEVTSIPVNAFEGKWSRKELEDYSIAQKMSWAAFRRTTREEDMAYCLMGIFGVNMPPIYGEGGAKAFMRLQLEIIKYSDDQSIFAWVASEDYRRDRGLFASSPSEFASSGTIRRSNSEDLGDKSSFSFSNNGLRIHLYLQALHDIREDLFFASLHCRAYNNGVIGIYLRKDGHRYVRWCPHFPLHHTDEPVGSLQEVVVKESAIPGREPTRTGGLRVKFKLASELTLLGEVDNDNTLCSIQSFLLWSDSFRTFRLKTKNGNEFDIGLWNRSGDVNPCPPFVDSVIFPLQDSCLLQAIDNGNGLASCFVYKTGDFFNQSNIEINYIPSSSPEFEYHHHINEFQCTSHAPSSTALNFILDSCVGPFSFNPPGSIFPSNPSPRWSYVEAYGYGSISYPSKQCDIHWVFQYKWISGENVLITFGLRTVSECRIPWIDIWVSDKKISDVWESYQHSGSRYDCRQQSRSTATFASGALITVTVQEKTMLDAPLYHVVIDEEYPEDWR